MIGPLIKKKILSSYFDIRKINISPLIVSRFVAGRLEGVKCLLHTTALYVTFSFFDIREIENMVMIFLHLLYVLMLSELECKYLLYATAMHTCHVFMQLQCTPVMVFFSSSFFDIWKKKRKKRRKKDRLCYFPTCCAYCLLHEICKLSSVDNCNTHL